MIRKATVEGGVVLGIPAADPRVTAFKGIPFAAPPVGENRWRAPQPVIPWEGELKCWNFAPISMQHIPGLDPNNIYTREWNVDPEIPMDEDCLYLNVWTPAKSTDEKLPVFVWYFGGGLREGNPAEMEFDGGRIARRGVVVVTVNYRLNVFGFLAHPELTASQPDAPTNFGNLDQQAGTRWVKRNIAAFGGDPDNITIGGQSAGGGSVCSQLSCPDNEGLFQKAIIMSGMFAGIYDERRRQNFEEAQAQGEKFFEFLGVKTLAEARAIDAVTLRDKGVEFETEFRARFGSVPDGKFLLADPLKRITAGNRLRVPIMIGRTQDEFRSRIDADTMDEFREKVTASLGEYAEPFLKACGDDLDTAKAMANVSGIEVAVRTFAKKNEEAGITEPIYYYVFNAEIPGWDNPGTFHSVDLWFFFENLAKCWRPFKGKHMDLARNMCNYWANFFRTGDPNGPDNDGTPMPLWKPYTDAEPNAIWFNDIPEPCVDKPSEAISVLVERNSK